MWPSVTLNLVTESALLRHESQELGAAGAEEVIELIEPWKGICRLGQQVRGTGRICSTEFSQVVYNTIPAKHKGCKVDTLDLRSHPS